MLVYLPEAAAIGNIILPALFSVWGATVRAVMAFALALRAFSDIGFEFWIIELRVVAHKTALHTSDIAFHDSLLQQFCNMIFVVGIDAFQFCNPVLDRLCQSLRIHISRRVPGFQD